MRILVKNKLNSFEVYFIINIFYDEYIKKSKKEIVEGLIFYDGQDYFAIPNVTKSECDEICKSLMINGYYDLTNFECFEQL